jgi:hypothetical protein
MKFALTLSFVPFVVKSENSLSKFIFYPFCGENKTFNFLQLPKSVNLSFHQLQLGSFYFFKIFWCVGLKENIYVD